MKVLVTGAAGFIGAKLADMLSMHGEEVVGLDVINEYYDTTLKLGRLCEGGIEIKDGCPFYVFLSSHKYSNYRFVRMDLTDKDSLDKLFECEGFDKVVHLAAQAGVRYSLENASAYVNSNLTGFVNLIECCRKFDIKHLVYASSSSVYGMSTTIPFSEDQRVDTPVSLYAATKKANELIAHSYSKLYGLPTTGLRYFTVYGPWGRPDMAPMLFARCICENEPLKIFNEGKLMRDFTYIDDIVEGTLGVLNELPDGNGTLANIPYEIYNIGSSNPIQLMDFIEIMESIFGKKAKKVFLPMQPGDMSETYADITKLKEKTGYMPRVNIQEGLVNFVEWYQSGKYIKK